MQFLIPFVSNGKPATLHCLDTGKSFSNRKFEFEVKQTQIPYFKRSGIIKTCPCRFVEGNEVPQTKPGLGPVHITIPNPSFKSHILDPRMSDLSRPQLVCETIKRACHKRVCWPDWLTAVWDSSRLHTTKTATTWKEGIPDPAANVCKTNVCAVGVQPCVTSSVQHRHIILIHRFPCILWCYPSAIHPALQVEWKNNLLNTYTENLQQYFVILHGLQRN